MSGFVSRLAPFVEQLDGLAEIANRGYPVQLPPELALLLIQGTRSYSRTLARTHQYGKDNVAAGLCRVCSNPSVEGKTLCQRHLEKKRVKWQNRIGE